MAGVRSKKAEMSSSREKMAGDFLERRRREISSWGLGACPPLKTFKI